MPVIGTLYGVSAANWAKQFAGISPGLKRSGASLRRRNVALDIAGPNLDPIAAIAANFTSIAVHPSVPARTLGEFITYANANPGKLSYGHAGIGSTNHLTGELFKMLAGTPEIVQVPYRGMGPAMTDLIGGQLAMAVPAVTAQVLDFHGSGKMRVLAVTSPKRLAGR